MVRSSDFRRCGSSPTVSQPKSWGRERSPALGERTPGDRSGRSGVSRLVPDAPFEAVPAALSRDRAVARLHALTAIAKAATGATGFMDALHRTSEAALVALEAASVSISVWERDQARVRVLVNTGDLGPGEVHEPV